MKRLAVLALVPLLVTRPALAQLSDADKKAAARAAFTEGSDFQDKGKYADALADFQKAEKLYDAPTHLLHIAECQAELGQLVEASETYESLTHVTLEKGAPDAFVQAQAQGSKELDALKPRIPTLRINVKPDPSTLQSLTINLNDKTMPAELVGIGRPINPGSYKITATATGYATTTVTTVDLKEKDTKTVDLTLEKGASAPATGATTTTTPPPKPEDTSGPSQLGLLLGIRPIVDVPFGKVDSKTEMKDYAGAEVGLGLDVLVRVAQAILVGGTLEGGVMKGPSNFISSDPTVLGSGASASIGVTTEYVGVLGGYMPNVDAITPTGWLGAGYRYIQRDVTLNGPLKKNFSDDVTGLDIGLHGGVSIPAGPIRIVPLVNVSAGEFGARSCITAAQIAGVGSGSCTTPDGAFYFMAGLSLGLYYDVDFGKKP